MLQQHCCNVAVLCQPPSADVCVCVCLPIQAIFVVLLLGWVFLPVYIASGVGTQSPDFSHSSLSTQDLKKNRLSLA